MNSNKLMFGSVVLEMTSLACGIFINKMFPLKLYKFCLFRLDCCQYRTTNKQVCKMPIDGISLAPSFCLSIHIDMIMQGAGAALQHVNTCYQHVVLNSMHTHLLKRVVLYQHWRGLIYIVSSDGYHNGLAFLADFQGNK